MTINVLSLVLPFRGVIAAGWPSPAEEELGDTLTFEEWLIPHKESSCLVTVGTNALKSAGVLLNDIVVMERDRTPQHGDLVIAEINGQLSIRQYEKLFGPVKLTSDAGITNIGKDSTVRILGVVASVIRRYR